jgi:hypothetical protein
VLCEKTDISPRKTTDTGARGDQFRKPPRFRLFGAAMPPYKGQEKGAIWATYYGREILLFVPRICISEFAQMRTKPTASAAPKRKMPASRKPARRSITSLAKQLAEVQALRDQLRKAEASKGLH